MKQKKLQILMLISAFFLMSNAFGQTNGFYLLNQGNGKYLQMVKAATDTSTANNNDGQLGFIDSKGTSTTCWTFTQCSSTQLVKFANSGNDNVVYFGQPNTQNQAWSYKLCGLAKYNSGTNSTAKASNQSDAGAGSKYNCYLYKINNYTATGTSFTATLTTTAEVGGYYFIASANLDQKGSGLMLMGNTIDKFKADNGSETQDVIAGTKITSTPNTTNITVSVDNIKNYIYLFESNVVKGIKYGKFSYVNEVEGGTASCAEIPSGTSWEGQSEDIAGPATKTFTLTANASNDDYTFKGWSDDGGKTIIDGSNLSPFTYTFSYSSTDKDSPTTVTLTPVFSAGLNFYLMNYDTGNYLNASGTKMSFSSEPQIWSMEESDDYMKIMPEGSDNSIAYSSSTYNSVFKLSSSTVNCTLYEINDIAASPWSATKTTTPVAGKYYLIVGKGTSNNYTMTNTVSATDGSLSRKSISSFNSISKNDYKACVYQFVKPTPGVTYYGELTVVAKDNLGTVSISEATLGNNVWSGSAKGYTGSATKVLNVSATPSEGYTFVGWSENGTNIISSEANYEYSFTFNGTEDAPQKATLTAVFAEKVSYFVYNLGNNQFLNNESSTSLKFSDTPQEWVTEVATEKFVNIMPEGSNNHLYCSESTTKTFALGSTTSNCWLYEIDDINAKTWTAKLVTIPTTDKCYFIVSHPGSSDYAMGNDISSNKITGTKGLFTISNESFSVENTDENKAYVYQFVKPTPAVTYYGELTVVAKDNLGTVSISEATSGNNVWSGSAKGYTGSATKVLNVSATPSKGYTFVGWSENGTDIISSEANYEYSFTFNGTEDAPQKATLTAVFAEKVSYFVYNLGNKQFLNNSTSTSLKFSDTTQEWVIELVAENLFRMKPESGTNNLYRSSSSYKLGNHASDITENYNNNLFEIEDINSSTWTAKLTNTVNPGKFYLVASWSDSKTSFYVMGNIISSNTISATKDFGFNDAHDVITVANTDANKAYVYQFTKSAYNIPVTSVEWASFYADFDVTIPQGVTAYTATGIDSGKITLAEVEDDVIPAKTAVVFSAAEGKVSFVNKGSVTTFSGTNLFEGSSVEKNIKTESCYTLCGVNNGNPVFKLYTGTILAANKAYLPITQGTEVKEMLSSVFDGANGIANINVNNDANSVRYNLNGQVVGKDFKGVVIMNGKKYLSK